jgi:hypothetical protein
MHIGLLQLNNIFAAGGLLFVPEKKSDVILINLVNKAP